MTKDRIGIDLVEIEEIEKRSTEKFVSRLLSDEEMRIYDRINDRKRRIGFLAGRFAAKEAYTKAYGSFDEPLNFRDVSILNDEAGTPYVVSKYRPEDTVLISISHASCHAVAFCMVRIKE